MGARARSDSGRCVTRKCKAANPRLASCSPVRYLFYSSCRSTSRICCWPKGWRGPVKSPRAQRLAQVVGASRNSSSGGGKPNPGHRRNQQRLAVGCVAVRSHRRAHSSGPECGKEPGARADGLRCAGRRECGHRGPRNRIAGRDLAGLARHAMSTALRDAWLVGRRVHAASACFARRAGVGTWRGCGCLLLGTVFIGQGIWSYLHRPLGFSYEGSRGRGGGADALRRPTVIGRSLGSGPQSETRLQRSPASRLLARMISVAGSRSQSTARSFRSHKL